MHIGELYCRTGFVCLYKLAQSSNSTAVGFYTQYCVHLPTQRRTYAPHAYCILCVDHRHNACANINTKLAAHVREQRTGDARAMRRFDLAAPGQTRQFMGRRVCGAWARAEIARNLNIFNNVLSPNNTNAHAHTRTTHTQHMCVGMLGRFGAGRFKIDRSCWCV